MTRFYLFVLATLCTTLLWGQQPEPHKIIPLWPDGAPTSNGITAPMEERDGILRNITRPTLTVFLPEQSAGMCVLACPGGGYHCVCTGTEGFPMAQWYLTRGIAYAVLHYRLPNGHSEVPLHDVLQAIRILRSHSAEWGFSRVGIQGCSAGGHLAAMASTQFTRKEERPDFQILFYPVISMDASFEQPDTRRNLLGENPSEEMRRKYSNEKRVTPHTPPAFIMHSADDGVVPVRHSVDYFSALQANGVSATLHIYPEGGHGWAYHDWFPYKHEWTGELERWLRRIYPRLH